MNGNAAVNQAAMTLAGTGPQVVKADQTRAFEPRDVDEAYELSKLLVASGFLGRSVNKPESAFAIIATGRELGLTAMQSLRSIHIIEGKPTLSADLIASLCKTRPDICQYFQLVESTDKIARYETHRKGDPKPTPMQFTWDDAVRAGVATKDNWKKWPAAMLRARCITALARAVYPDLAMGLYDPDEVEDIPRAAPQPYEVVASPAPAPPPADGKTFQKLCDRVDAAENAPTINGVASATAKAHKAGQITDEQYEKLKTAIVTKRELIGAPKPPASAPSAPADDTVHIDEEGEPVLVPAERQPGEEG